MPEPSKGFDVTNVTDRLHYNLGPYGGEGDVPQPTMAEVRKLREALYAAQEKITGLPLEGNDEAQEKELLKRLTAMTAAQRDELSDVTLDAVIEFCKGSPSRDALTACPAPVRVAFVDWLLGEFDPLF